MIPQTDPAYGDPKSGYVKPRLGAVTEENLRRMVRRMQLDATDAEVWQGMLRQISWKIDQAR